LYPGILNLSWPVGNILEILEIFSGDADAIGHLSFIARLAAPFPFRVRAT